MMKISQNPAKIQTFLEFHIHMAANTTQNDDSHKSKVVCEKK